MDKIQDYTRSEFLKLVEEIAQADGTEDYQNSLVDKFERLSEHPSGSDLIFWPDDSADDSPEGIVKTVEQWRTEKGLPLFREDQ